MIIGVDASQVIKNQKTGVQWYAYHLLNALRRITPQAHQVTLYTPIPLPAELSPMPSHWEEKVLPWAFGHGWTACKLSTELRRNPPDVFFTPGHIIPPFAPSKTVVTIHDLGFREFPRAYKHPRLMDFLHKRDTALADAIITPSITTKNAVINAYQVTPDKIHVIPHGYDADVYHPYDEVDIQQILNKYGIKKPYVISVGRLEEKKNTHQVLKLIYHYRHAELDSASRNIQLVLVGSRGYGYEKVQRWIQKNSTSSWIHELGWLPSIDTAKLISGASALIALSRAEGFGLTILEALACHTPVLATDIPAHREVGKDIITYVDPNNLTDSTNKLLNIINHDVSHTLSSGEGSLSNYSWQNSAQQTLDLLLSITHLTRYGVIP